MIRKLKLATIAALLLSFSAFSQNSRLLQYERPIGRNGVHIFEAPKADTMPYDGFKVRLGGDFSIIF